MPDPDAPRTTGRAPLGVGGTVAIGASVADEEERRRIAALAAAAEAAKKQAAKKAGGPVTDILRRPDQATVLQSMIDKGGGPVGYSQRVNYLATSVRKKLGVEPDPTFILELALLPLSTDVIMRGVNSGISNFYRGLNSRIQTDEIRRWQASEMVPSGRLSTTKAKQVDERSQQELDAHVAAVTGQRVTSGLVVKDPAPNPFNPYWFSYRQENEEMKARRYAGYSWTRDLPANPPPGERLFTELQPTGVGAVLGWDVRTIGEADPTLNPEAKRSNTYNIELEAATAQELGITDVRRSFKPGFVMVRYLDLKAAGEVAKVAGVTAAVAASLPFFYPVVEHTIGWSLEKLGAWDNLKDDAGWKAHATWEYFATGRRMETPTSFGVYKNGGSMMARAMSAQTISAFTKLKTYGPNGEPVYLSSTPGMNEEMFLKVLELQGAKYQKNADGSVSITKWAPPIDQGKSTPYRKWLADYKESVGETLVSGALKELGFIKEPKEGESAWDMRRFIGFAGDMFYYGIGDMGAGGGINASTKLIGVQRYVKAGVSKTGWIKNVSQMVAESSDPRFISKITGVKDPTVLRKWADLGTAEEVAHDMTTVLQEGFRLEPTDFMVKQQIKMAITSSDEFQRLPTIIKSAFRVGPERFDFLELADPKIVDSAEHLGYAFGMNESELSLWTNRLVREPIRDRRVGILMEMFDYAKGIDEKTFAKAEKRWLKYKRKGAGAEPGNVFAVEPQPVPGKVEPGTEISGRTRKSLHDRELKNISRLEKQKAALEQMELAGTPSEEDILRYGEKLATQRAEFAQALDWAETYYKEAKAQMIDLEVKPGKIRARAQELRDADFGPRQADYEALRWLHDAGGFSYKKSAWDQSLSAAEKLSLMHNRWHRSRPTSLWSEDIYGYRSMGPDELAQEMITARPDLASAIGLDPTRPADSLWDFLRRVQKVDYRQGGKGSLKPYMVDAELELLDRQAEMYPALFEQTESATRAIAEYRAQIAAVDKVDPANLGAYEPFKMPAEAPGILAASKRAQELEGIDLELRASRARLEEIKGMGEGIIPTPLFEYQLAQYWRTPVPLDIISSTYAGPIGQALDSLQRGVVVPNTTAGKMLAAGVAGVPAGAVAGEVAESLDLSPEYVWMARLAAFASAGYVGKRLAMRWAKNLDAEDYIKVTPNVDYLTALWKRYALGSVGVLFRVAGDEPTRMASRGFGKDAIKAWFRNDKMIDDAIENGWYKGPYSYEKGIISMSYLMENRYPTEFVQFAPTQRGWSKSYRSTMTVIQNQQSTRYWVEAMNAGLPGEEGLRRMAQMHPDTIRNLAKRRGTSVDEWIQQENEYLTKLSHRRMTKNGNYGYLNEAQQAEWEAFKEAGEGATAPAWFRPNIDAVIREGSTGELLHLRRHERLYGFLSGKYKLTAEELKKLPINARPYISARRQKGALMAADGIEGRPAALNAVDAMYNVLYGRFDTAMRNVRNNIYLREYKREMEGLTRLATERGVGIDNNVLHELADRKAKAQVDFMTYSSQRTGLENLMRDIVPFAPATRDFLTFWLAEGMRRPSRLVMFTRLATEMPEEVEVHYDQDTLGALGKTLEWLTASDSFSFNPRALSFITGGATMPRTTKDAAWSFVEQQFPGFGPFITVPAHWLAVDHPDKFGLFPSFWGMENRDMTKIPGMALVARNIPLFSRTERFIWAATATAAAFAGSKSGGYDFAQSLLADIPWLGRDKEARDRLVNLEIQWIMVERGMDNQDVSSLTEEERLELLNEAKSRIVKREGATGFLGFVLPAIPWFYDREQQDVRASLNEYKETYYTWAEPPEPLPTPMSEYKSMANIWMQPNVEQPPFLPQEEPAWGEARRRAERDQERIRKRLPEYAAFFDYIDAIERGDTEKFYQVGTDHPEVVSYFVSMYNNNYDIGDYTGADMAMTDPGGLDTWASVHALGGSPLKPPGFFVTEEANKATTAKNWNTATSMWKDFEKRMVAEGTATIGRPFTDQDREYQEAFALLRDQIRNSMGERFSTPGQLTANPYYDLGLLTPEQMGLTSEAKEKQDALTVESLKAEYEDAIAEYAPSDPSRDFVKGEFIQRFKELGLDPAELDKSKIQYLPGALRTELQYLEDIRREPFSFQPEDFTARGMRYTETTHTSMAQALDLRRELLQMTQDYGGSVWDSKYDAPRNAYFEYIRGLADQDGGFADLWTYYQAQFWERMQASNRYTSETWRAWFDALAQRDYWVDSNIESGVCTITAKGEPGAQQVKELVAWMMDYAQQLKEYDPDFAKEFDVIPLTYWSR